MVLSFYWWVFLDVWEGYWNCLNSKSWTKETHVCLLSLLCFSFLLLLNIYDYIALLLTFFFFSFYFYWQLKNFRIEELLYFSQILSLSNFPISSLNFLPLYIFRGIIYLNYNWNQFVFQIKFKLFKCGLGRGTSQALISAGVLVKTIYMRLLF